MLMKKASLVGIVVAIIVIFFVFDLGHFLTLDYIKEQQQQIETLYAENKLLTLGLFFLLYVVVTGASLPGATVLTMAAGAIFGFITGLILVSFASSIGASLAFVISRYLFRDTVEARFGSSLSAINNGIKKDGALYLFALRLVPAFPFFVINLVMGLTPIKLKTFYWVSQLGMFAGTIVYVNAGTQLGQISSASEILSVELILSFLLLAMLPFVGKVRVTMLKNRKALAGFANP